MLHFLTDNIFILLGGRLFQRTIGIPKGRNRPPILADLLLHVYEAFCLEELLKNKNRKLVQTFISSFRCIDDVLSLNNSVIIYIAYIQKSSKLTYANDTQRYSYLDLHTEIVNFHCIRSHISASSAYGVYAPQLIRYSRTCTQNSDVMYRTQPLTQKLLKQGYAANRVRSSLHKVYGGHPNRVDRCEI